MLLQPQDVNASLYQSQKYEFEGITTAFLVNAGMSIIPTKAPAFEVNYLAERAGLWAEKGLVRRTVSKTKSASLSTP